jgi:hypothetical protein
VGFFEELPDPPAPPRQRQPDWIGPPGNEAPVAVPLQLVAGRNDQAAVILGGARVYSTGIELQVTMLVRNESDWFFDPLHLHHPRQSKSHVLRLAVVCSDGSQAEAVRSFPHPGGTETGRVLSPTGGGGGQGRWSHGLWLWPLPTPGTVEVVCAWPAFGIEETRTSFDAGPLLEAAARVEVLWPENADAASGGSVSTQQIRFASSDGD